MILRLKAKHHRLLSRKAKCFLQFRKFHLLSNNDLYEKLKNSNYLIKLIKDVKDGTEKEYKEEHGLSNIDLGISYLYKNVIMNKGDEKKKKKKKEMMMMIHDNFDDSMHASTNLELYDKRYCNYAITIKQCNDVKSALNIKEVYLYIMNSLNSLTVKQVLLILYSFFVHNMNIVYLKKINEHIINNIYNFKTNDLILIHLFYIYFENKYSYKKGDTHFYLNNYNVFLIRNKFKKDAKINSLNDISSVHREICKLANALIKYSSYLFYKRKQSLHLSQIAEILFLCHKYNNIHNNMHNNIYTEELLDHFVSVLDNSLQLIDISNVELALSEKEKNIKNKNALYDLTKFYTIIDCFYYISGIKKVCEFGHKKNKYFFNFCSFLKRNYKMLSNLDMHQLFLLLQVGGNVEGGENVENVERVVEVENVWTVGRGADNWDVEGDQVFQNFQNSRMKYAILKLIEEKLKQPSDESPQISTVVTCKYFNKCVDTLYSVYLYSNEKYILQNNKNSNVEEMHNEHFSHNSNTDNGHGEMGFENDDKRREEKGEGKYKENYICIDMSGGLHSRVLLNTNRYTTENMSANKHDNYYATDGSKINMKHNRVYKSHTVHLLAHVKFLDSINHYIKTKGTNSKRKYLPILLSSLENSINYKNMLIYFINSLDKTTDIDILLFYIISISTHINNIYVLSYLGYLYERIRIGQFSNSSSFTSDKIEVLLSSLYRLINNNNSYGTNLEVQKDFYKNNKEFFLLLYRNNLDVYEHIKGKLLNMNVIKIRNVQEFLFHYTYKYMIQNTFICLEKKLYYINDLTTINELLYYFLNINNYNMKYSSEISSDARKISILFFEKIFILNFLSIYKDAYNPFHNAVRKILVFISTDTNVDNNILLNYVMNIYFQSCISAFTNNIFTYITNILEDLFKDHFHLTYKNEQFVLFLNSNNLNFDSSKNDIINIMSKMIDYNFNIYIINFLILVYANVNFNKLFHRIKDYLYSYAI
ncbi:conserved Plasmodium protein, unknown function [Plasmodium malariae]|uniref:Uncharacterized protein n=2 Tax=Plasmodium (Plasmodium) TaxID=418103 RepID=A0A1D3SQ11_PLAMA|nr:conserved Plasmodium protein, unknown function [Plasmodium malariae]SCO93977.1 conserved Plasmodium protein, unknown function [Plasmodium malariae]